jgi:hypothetical protein
VRLDWVLGAAAPAWVRVTVDTFEPRVRTPDISIRSAALVVLDGSGRGSGSRRRASARGESKKLVERNWSMSEVVAAGCREERPGAKAELRKRNGDR